MKILENCEMIVDVLHRIQADRDIPFHGVKVGDVGGWVEKPNNLQDDACYLYGDALIEGEVFGNAYVQKNARIGQYAKVFDNANIGGDAKVRGYAEVGGDALIHSYAIICDHAIVTDSAEIGQNCNIMDYAFIGGSARLEELTVKGFVKFDLPVTINRYVTLFDSNDFVSFTSHGETCVYIKLTKEWFPALPSIIKNLTAL